MGPGGVFVVWGSGFEAAVEVADESVCEGAEGLVVEVACGSVLVIELAAAGAGLQGAEGPLVAGVVETPVADMSGQHDPFGA